MEKIKKSQKKNQSYNDFKRQRNIERKLENEKRHWFFERRYLNRTMIQWVSLYFGLFLVILTLAKKTFDIADLFLMLTAGLQMSIWFLGSLINTLQDQIKESIEMSIKTLKILATKELLEKEFSIIDGEEE